uniref:Uncharacterized protein n=2 Tax=Sus scrofa TaxID=9823 RepID=A0A4X1VNA2_PIG
MYCDESEWFSWPWMRPSSLCGRAGSRGVSAGPLPGARPRPGPRPRSSPGSPARRCAAASRPLLPCCPPPAGARPSPPPCSGGGGTGRVKGRGGARAGPRAWGWRASGHLALGLRLLAAAFAELRLQPLVLRRQVLQLLLQRRPLRLHAVQQVAVDVVLRADGRGSRTRRGAAEPLPSPSPAAAHLRLELHHALPQLAALGQSLGLA